jgi:hypothetical protein
MGVDHRSQATRDRSMLGNAAAAPSEQQNIAGIELI